MADVQKPVEVPEAAPVAALEPVVPETTPAVKAAPAAETPAVAEAKTEETPAEAAAETPAEEAKKEVKPIEKGRLEHKASPASFPK